MSAHWTVSFIGMAYDIAGVGPDAYNCWTFFGAVEKRVFRRELPPIEIPQAEKLPAIVRAFRDHTDAFGWRKLEPTERRRDGDAVLLSHRNRPHHIGVFVEAVPMPAVLHCLEGTGSVLHSLLHLEIGAWNVVSLYRPRGN